MQRRVFLKQAMAAALATGWKAAVAESASAPVFTTRNAQWQQTYDKALAVLAGNVRVLPHYDKPVLIEGAEYAGIWQECGPLEALVYRRFQPQVARNSHMVFFALQHEDGQLPANNKKTETGFGQIQMVVPIAATAWELARATGDQELLEAAYGACSRWDAWLMRYRNTRGTGLVEGFCTYDTGMDNSPRWAGMPRQCPHKDARQCPDAPGLPRLCPDLSATVYGGRRALAEMADALGKRSEADNWREDAEKIRKLILAKLYVSEDAAFYDLDAQNEFVKVRTCAVTRVCGEHVIDQRLFDELWTRQLHDAKAFWAPYPFPSVAMDDPKFVRPIPRNSWGGASQALTALRTGRWMEHYGRTAEYAMLMDAWCTALRRDGTFRQQVDPLTGMFSEGDQPGYSPASLLMVDFTWRLVGIHEEPQEIWWNVRPHHAAAEGSVFRMQLDAGGVAELRYAAGGASLRINEKPIATVEGTARLVTDTAGKPLRLAGIQEKQQKVVMKRHGKSHRFAVAGNQTVKFPE